MLLSILRWSCCFLCTHYTHMAADKKHHLPLKLSADSTLTVKTSGPRGGGSTQAWMLSTVIMSWSTWQVVRRLDGAFEGQWLVSIQDCSKIGTFQPPAINASTLFLHLACFEDYKQYSQQYPQHEEQIKDIWNSNLVKRSSMRRRFNFFTSLLATGYRMVSPLSPRYWKERC